MPRISRRFTRQGDLLVRAQRLAANLADNAEELSNAGVSPSYQATLEEKLTRARELTLEHAALTAKKQEAYQQLRQTLDETAKLTSFLEAMLKEHYGTRSESLVGFGVQPFRGRKKRTAPPESSDSPPEPSSPSSDGSTPAS